MFEQRYQPTGVVNVFVVKGQLQVVINDDEGRPFRCAIPLQPGKLQGSISGHTVTVEWNEHDTMQMAIGKKYALTLKQQPKGHFFSPLRVTPAADKLERVDPAEAFKQLQAARKAGK